MEKGKGNAIMIALGKPKDEPDEASEEESDDIDVDDDLVSAMKVFESAGSTEEKAKALKAFIKLCGGY